MKFIKQHLLFILGISISLLLLWLSLRDVESTKLITSISNVNAIYLIPFILSLFIYYWLKVIRWKILLKPTTNSSLGQLYPPMMIGYAGNLILPMQLGEFVRVILAAKSLNIHTAPVLTSVVLERLFDFFTLFVLIGLTTLFNENNSATLASAFFLIGIGCLGATLILLFYIFFTDQFVSIFRKATVFLPSHFQSRLIDFVIQGADGLHAIKDPGLLMRIILISLLQWGMMWICVYLSIIATGLDISIFTAFIVLIFVIIGISIPTSPGYIGSIQAAYYIALSSYSISASAALTASLFYHITAYISVLVVGLYYLKKQNITFSSLKMTSKIKD